MKSISIISTYSIPVKKTLFYRTFHAALISPFKFGLWGFLTYLLIMILLEFYFSPATGLDINVIKDELIPVSFLGFFSAFVIQFLFNLKVIEKLYYKN